MRGVTGHSCRTRTRKRFLLTRPMRGVTHSGCSATRWTGISTHTPHARRDRKSQYFFDGQQFLLTRPMRGVTGQRNSEKNRLRFLLTRPMRGVTMKVPDDIVDAIFLLTRPMRGVTSLLNAIINDRYISTHTPHARRDDIRQALINNSLNFYSHAPCEA